MRSHCKPLAQLGVGHELGELFGIFFEIKGGNENPVFPVVNYVVDRRE